jgi:hypothetical protein
LGELAHEALLLDARSKATRDDAPQDDIDNYRKALEFVYGIEFSNQHPDLQELLAYHEGMDEFARFLDLCHALTNFNWARIMAILL